MKKHKRSSSPYVSLVVVAYNMPRELPRTIRSLSPEIQRGVDAEAFEIIVVDNGSTPAVDADSLRAWGADVQVITVANPVPSPAAAINQGIEWARGELIGVMIDGARIASPGLVAGAIQASRLHPNPVIGTLGFHLGPDVQHRSIQDGYNQEQEDQLLDSVNWIDDAYRLFDISVFAGSSQRGWFAPIDESNAVFLTAAAWRDLGGFDSRFTSPGGGLVNLDTWKRACGLLGSQMILLLGEGTFHQIHGGVATNALEHPWAAFHDEYVSIRGHKFSRPTVQPLFIGTLHSSTRQSIISSALSLQPDSA